MSTYPLVARAVAPVPALEATTETTLKTPAVVISPTTVPEESLNWNKGAVAPEAALTTKASSNIVTSGADSILKRAIDLLF